MKRKRHLLGLILSLCLVVTQAALDAPRASRAQRKRQGADFDCPDEFGYYAHPSDCSLYYVCVFGGPLLESCTGGLMYSQELQTCDWPRNVGCTNGTTSSSSLSSSSSTSLDSQVVVVRVPDISRKGVTLQTPATAARRVNEALKVPGSSGSGRSQVVSRAELGFDNHVLDADEFGLSDADRRDERPGRSYQGHQPSLSNAPSLALVANSAISGRRSSYTSVPSSSSRNSGLAPPYVSDAPLRQLVADVRGNSGYRGGPSGRPTTITPVTPLRQQEVIYSSPPPPPPPPPPPRVVQQQRPVQYTTVTSSVRVPTTYQPANRSYSDYDAYYVYDDELYPDVEYTEAARTRAPPTLTTPSRNPQYLSTRAPVQLILTTSAAPIPRPPPPPPPPPTRLPYLSTRANSIKQTIAQSSRPSYSSSSASTSSISRGRSRPTLKPSSAVVAGASEYIDIYRYPPRRPPTLYATPQPDAPASKCRRDECALPDCHCGGKEIPGGLDVSEVPQLVMLTFDDSVNDLNKGLYESIFAQGRVNANGCPIAATFFVSHEWTDYSQVQNLYSDGHEIASHSIAHSFGEQFSQRKWAREIAGQREILAAYGGVHLEDVRGMRAPFLAVGGNNMFKMLYDYNFTYDSSMPVYENRPPSWPYTLDYKIHHDCMIPPCPTKSYPGVWEVPMVMWQDLNGGRCSMGDACSNPPTADGVYKMLIKNFERHYTTNRAPFGLFYHAAWFTQPHHKEGFLAFMDTLVQMEDVWLVTAWQALQWMRDPVPLSKILNYRPFGCDFSDRPRRCNHPKVCNLWHKSGVRYMRTCQPCPDVYPWTGRTGVRNSRVDNEVEDS